MKNLVTSILCGWIGLCSAYAVNPDIVVKTNIYETSGSANSFTISLGAAYGCTGSIEVMNDRGLKNSAQLEVAYYDGDNTEFIGTDVPCQVGANGWIKIYCDEGVVIDYVGITGAEVTSIEFAHPETISILSLEHNSLGSLDIDALTNLNMLSVKDNPFDIAPLSANVENHNLQILDISLIDNIDPEFDIIGFPNLKSFDAMSTHGLKKLTPSACPGLQKISVDNTSISSLDVTKNAGLYILNISETRIQEIDLSQCPLLQQFYAQHESSYNADIKLKSLDVSKNPDLIYLFVTGNDFENIDISNNKYLTDLFARKNKFQSIDLTNNEYLLNVFISGNLMDFNTLPLIQNSWLDYDLTQKDIFVPRSYQVGSPIDLTPQLVLNRSDIEAEDREETTAVLYSVDPKDIFNLTEISSECYSFEDGVLTINEVIADSVLAVFSNPLFPNTTLRTSQFKIKDAEKYGNKEVFLTFGNNLSEGDIVKFSIGLDNASIDNPRKFYIDFGDGNLTELIATTSEIPSNPNVEGIKAGNGDINVYLDETDRITALKIEDIYLTSIDVTNLKELRQLELINTELYTLDLSWNRCLTSLVVKGNHFGNNFSLAGVSGDYGKNVLSHIDLSNNEMTSVELLSDPLFIKYLDLSDNIFTNLNFKDYDNVEYLNVSGNALTELTLNYCASLYECDASNNQLESIILPEDNNITKLNISNNKFNFATLPLPWTELTAYNYAPQLQLQIPDKGPGCDISSFLIDIDNVATSYVWRSEEEDNELIENDDYILEDKYVRFADDITGKNVFCEFTNSIFPAFVGGNALRTNIMKVDSRPNNELLSFVTPFSQTVQFLFMSDKDNNAVFIDWAGDGELQQYSLPEAGGRYEFSGTSVAGAEVKVYSYDEDDHITFFRLTDTTVKELDLSGLNQLSGLRLSNCGLNNSEIKAWPTSDLIELYLEKNKFDSFDFSQFPTLNYITFSNNALTDADISMLSELQTAAFSNNKLSSIKIDNSKLWSLDLSINKLSEIDFSNMPQMYQLFLNDNNFANFDLDALYSLNDLRVLYVDRNKLDFSTLPVPQNNWTFYVYGNQATLEVEPIDGVVDLSKQAQRDGEDTEIIWFLGVPVYDSSTGEISGEILTEGEQYTIEDGITTFLDNFEKVTGILLNPLFPSAYLQTNTFTMSSNSIVSLNKDEFKNTDIYNMQGIKVNSNALTPGIYIIAGKKVLIK